jgi:membrane protein YdbS with pleckstrin-like domain
MRLLEGEEVIWQGTPTWRSTVSFYLKWTLLVVLPLVVIIAAKSAGQHWSLSYGFLILVVGFALVVAVGWLRRHFTRYTITTKHLLIRTGVLSRHENSASLDRVQNIRVVQSPIDRMLKTGSVDFDTASGDATDAELRFVGIDRPRDLRDEILSAIERTRGADRQGGLA